MSKYEIYNMMFNKCGELEDGIRESLTKHCARIYNIEVYVGNEDTREYELFIEYSVNGNYHNYKLMMTEEKIIKHFI